MNQNNETRPAGPPTSSVTRPIAGQRPFAEMRSQQGPARSSTTNPIPAPENGARTVYRATAVVRQKKRRRVLRTVLISLAALAFIGIAAGWIFLSLTFQNIVQTTAKVFPTPLPERTNAEGTNVPVTFPVWGKEPVNILLIGLDYRPQEQDTRADTQIVVHVDPVNKTAAMMSIPRDMWVKIPQFGENRINSAFQLGDSHKDKILGGGPGLAMETVSEDFGIPIHYFVQVDFAGFEKVIDAVGGVTIDVPRPLVDDDYPLPNYGSTRIYIPAGLQHMDGRTALQYARSRHADSDIGRNSRQQQVLLAVRQQGLTLNLLARINDLANQVGDSVKTDLSIQQIGSLAQLSKEIGPESIHTVLLQPPAVNEYIIPETQADVLMPDWNVIRPLVAQAFGDPRLLQEGARLAVQNGTNTGGVARRVSDQLSGKGFNVVDVSSVQDPGTHPKTTVVDYTAGQKPHTVDALVTALGINKSAVISGQADQAPVAASDSKPVDIVVIVGDDKAK